LPTTASVRKERKKKQTYKWAEQATEARAGRFVAWMADDDDGEDGKEHAAEEEEEEEEGDSRSDDNSGTGKRTKTTTTTTTKRKRKRRRGKSSMMTEVLPVPLTGSAVDGTKTVHAVFPALPVQCRALFFLASNDYVLK